MHGRDLQSRKWGSVCRGLPPLLLLLGGCSLDAPKAPKFETELHLPLGTRLTTGRDLLEDSEYLEGDTTGASPLRFVVEGQIEPVEIGDFLALDTPASRFEARPAEIALASPSARSADFRLRALSPLFAALPEGSSEMVVPPFEIPAQSTTIAPLEEISWARLSGGRLRLELHNDLPVPLAGASGEAALELRCFHRGATGPLWIARMDEPIPAGAVRTFEADLRGGILTGPLELELRGSSAGSAGVPLEIRPDEHRLLIAAEFFDLAADSVQAIVPAQSIRLVDSVRVADDVRLLEGEVRSGSIPITVDNALPLGASARLSWPDVHAPDGTPLSLDLVLPAGDARGPSRVEARIDLTGARIVARAGVPRRTLSWELALSTERSTGTVSLGSGRGAMVTFAPSRLEFEYLRGAMDARRFVLPATETTIDPPEGLDELRFERAELQLELESSIGIAAAAELNLAGVPADGSAPVLVPLSLSLDPPESPGELRRTHYLWDEADSAILELIAARPRVLRVDGALRVGADDRIGTVARSDLLRGSFRLSAPLRARIGRIRHRTEPFRLSLDDDVVTRIRENVVSAEAVGQVRNHLPAGLTARLRFARQEADLDLDPLLHPDRVVELDSLRVAAGAIDLASGRVAGSTDSELRLEIRPEQVPFFAAPELVGRIDLELDGGGDSVVEVTAADFVEMNAMLRFRVRVNP